MGGRKQRSAAGMGVPQPTTYPLRVTLHPTGCTSGTVGGAGKQGGERGARRAAFSVSFLSLTIWRDKLLGLLGRLHRPAQRLPHGQVAGGRH